MELFHSGGQSVGSGGNGSDGDDGGGTCHVDNGLKCLYSPQG